MPTPFADASDQVVDTPSGDLASDGQRPALITVGLGLSYASAVTTPWNAVRLGGLAFGDIFLFLAAVTLVAGDLQHALPRLPTWVWAMAWSVLAVGVANQFAPPTAVYLQSRSLLESPGIMTNQPPASVNLVVMAPLLARILLLAFVFSLARAHDSRAGLRAMTSFVVGVAISSVVAFTDSRGLTAIGALITGVAVEAQRGSGLTQQTNVVAYTCVLALPLVVWQIGARRGARRALACFALFTFLLGLYASRSRSGAAAAAFAGMTAVIWLPHYRRHLATIGLVLAVIAAVAFVADPGLGTAVLHGLRLTGTDTSGSDHARTVVNDQAVRDFLHSPIYGIGFEVAVQAHVVYLQALAVGGVILLIGLLTFQGGALLRSARLAKTEPLAIPLFVSVLGGAVFNAEQNALIPTIAYMTAGFVAALPLSSDDARGTGSGEQILE